VLPEVEGERVGRAGRVRRKEEFRVDELYDARQVGNLWWTTVKLPEVFFGSFLEK
jgi:hypothetical protein